MATVSALEVAPNGVTIRATQPREFYEDNQRHTLDGKEYIVVLTKEALKEAPDKSLYITTFITDMSSMFYDASSFNGDISRWDTSKVEDMRSMFDGASSFNGDISRWDTSKVVDMTSMFWGASSFNGDISGWVIRPDCDTTGMLQGTLLDYYQQRKDDTLKATETIKEELITTTWHPIRLVWCLDEESKEEVDTLF